MAEFFKRFGLRLKKKQTPDLEAFQSEEDFLESIYQELLGRKPDEGGKLHYLKSLKEGNSRLSVILSIVRSEEFTNKVIRENLPLPPIKNEKPQNYYLSEDIEANKELWVFKVKEKEDFDWLERKIIENGYYEKPGVWSLQISEDKRLLAEIASIFNPESVLDIGCANGPVMKCLKDIGIYSEGIDISRLALEKAFPEVRENIHLGDILEVKIERTFDLILGLDIFEHLNPNKLSLYIQKIYNLLKEDGYLYCNIPAFGRDQCFGEIFKVYLKEWEEDVINKRCFYTIHVDNYGYPLNGHIIAAHTEWWVKQFETLGFKREVEIEKALHLKYDEAIEKIHVARKAYYVFSKNKTSQRRSEILKKIS